MINQSKNKIEFYACGKLIDLVRKNFAQNTDIQDLILGENFVDSKGRAKDAILLEDGYITDNLFVSDTQTETKAFITMDAIISESSAKINCFLLTVNVFMHNTILPLSDTERLKFISKGYFGNRLNVLIDGVIRLVYSNLDKEGIGGVTIQNRTPMSYFQPSASSPYYGKTLRFEVYDFKGE